MTMLFSVLAVLSLCLTALARDIVVTVGGNTTDDAGAVYQPQSVIAEQGDRVIFNFTQGNHSATQALFASPCIPAHLIDPTINGFDSGYREAGNFTSVTTLPVVIDNPNITIWFYDTNTCGEGGVGGININESSWETLDGFTRNARRLNGSDADLYITTSTSASATRTGTGAPATQTAENSANRAIAVGTAAVAPLLALALMSVSM